MEGERAHQTDQGLPRAQPKKSSQELIDSAVPLIVDNRYAFFYLIESIFAINSGEGRVRETKLIERSLNFMRTRDNRRLVSFFIKNRVTTREEIETSLGIEESSISKKLKTLSSLGLIEKKGRIGLPYKTRRSRGAGVPLWGLLNAEPQDYVEAQRRYGDILLATKDPSPIRQCQMPEAIALCKTYMDDRGIKAIPDSRILTPMLEVQGVKVSYDSLLNALAKEGYSL